MCVVSINFTSLFRSWLMPVTRPLLSCSPFLSFQSAFRASGQSVPSVHGSCTTCTSCSQKSHVHPSHHSCAVCAASRAALICSTASCIFLPLCPYSRCSCLFIQRLALAVVLDGEQSRSGRISMHPAEPLGRWVFYILAVAGLTVFFMWETQTYCGSVGSGCADTYK